MKAVFNFKVDVSESGVTCNFSTNEVQDMDINMQMQILKVFQNVRSSVDKAVNRFYAINGGETPAGGSAAEQEVEEPAPETQEEPGEGTEVPENAEGE